MTGELTARRRFARAHLFTAGVEVRQPDPQPPVGERHLRRDARRECARHERRLLRPGRGSHLPLAARQLRRPRRPVPGLRLSRDAESGPRAAAARADGHQAALRPRLPRAQRLRAVLLRTDVRRSRPARPGADAVVGDRVGGIGLEARSDGGDGLRATTPTRSSNSRRRGRRHAQRASTSRTWAPSAASGSKRKWRPGCRTASRRASARPSRGCGIRSPSAPVSNSPRSPVEAWRPDSGLAPVRVGRRPVRRGTADARRRDARRVLHVEHRR